jgi:murein DD-endopeptidase MepM/ murein hydrolase activator NlpD
VYAVGIGKVVQAVDGLPDQVPDDPEPVTIEDADGNDVILRLAKGIFAFSAHLRPGTVTVEVGDHVLPGEVLGETGNSGSSTGPHLHFQLMDRPSALKANGVPYVLRNWELEGQGPPLAELLMIDPVTTPVPIATDTAGPQRRTLPLGSNLIDHGY